MKYLSVCSGVEAATVAWHHMGWQAAGFSEIEKFPSEVLAHHYPTVTNYGDMTQYKEWNLGSIDLLVGGTPCQSFSVAGLRKGMDDPRGNLALVYCGILNHYRPKWFVWENVPGVLSSNRGRDFGAFLGALAELGYGFAYRVLDAQYWGVAQRRKRVFVVGYLGDWRPAGAVLFEPKSVSRDTAPSRKEGQGVAGGFVPSIASTIQTTCHDYSRADGFNMIATGAFGKEIADTVTAKFSKGAELLQQGAQNGGNCVLQPMKNLTYGIPGNWIGRKPENGGNATAPMDNVAPCLTKTDRHGVVYSFDSLASNSMKSSNPLSGCREVDLSKTIDTTYPCPSKNQGGIGILQSQFVDVYNHAETGELAATFGRNSGGTNTAGPKVMQNMAVRRLTPVECERLQGFPDDYTNIKDKCPDGPRYKAMGNSMAVPVMRWIGERINKVNSLL
jgi:DNA (cytosine-5)-methyltransferase 1